MNYEQMQDIIIEVAFELTKLHALGLSHNKVSPQSVMLTTNGKVVLCMSLY